MPKAPKVPQFPLNGLVGIEKPSGPTSMSVIDSIKPLLCESKFFLPPNTNNHTRADARKMMKRKGGLKIGQGGTLDPLADGVLVIGIGKGTKNLSQFLECTKSYTTVGLLGSCTTSFDSDGEVISTAPYQHVTRELIESVLDKFRGNIYQMPPIYSALKMDGKPLYEYARENKPLPRAIDPRAVTVSELVLEEFTPAQIVTGDGGHTYETPTKHLSAEELETYRKLTELTKVDVGDKTVVGAAGIPDAKQEEQAAKEEQDAKKESEVAEDVKLETATSLLKPPTFKLRMTVTSGTYVRSIVHDVGLAIGSAAHVVKLTRTRQGQFALEAGPEKLERDSECYVHDENGPDRFDFGERKGGVIPWDVLERAIKQRKAEIEKEKQDADAMASGEIDEEEMTANQPENGKWRPKEWEREFYARFVSTV